MHDILPFWGLSYIPLDLVRAGLGGLLYILADTGREEAQPDPT